MEKNWIDGKQKTSEEIAEQYALNFYEIEAFKEHMRIFEEGAVITAGHQEDETLFLLRSGIVVIYRGDIEIAGGIRLAAPRFINRMMLGAEVRDTEIRVLSEDALIYVLKPTTFKWALSDERWREMLVLQLLYDLNLATSELYYKERRPIVVQGKSGITEEKVKELEEKIKREKARMVKIFSTVLKILGDAKESVTESGRVWYYLDTLDIQIRNLLESFVPAIAESLGEADPDMLKVCQKKDASFFSKKDLLGGDDE